MNFLSKNLKFLRQSRSLSQKEISDLLGLKPNTISNYEKNISEPDIDTTIKLVKILEVEIKDFLYIDIEKEGFLHSKMSAQLSEKTSKPALNKSAQVSAHVSVHQKYRGFQGVNLPIDNTHQEGYSTHISGLKNGNTGNDSSPLIVAEEQAKYEVKPRYNEAPIITIDANEEQFGAICMLIDTGAAAGWPGAVSSPEWYQALPQFRLPFFRSGEFICIPAIGDSMEPTLTNGEWLLAKRITEAQDIREGYVHIVLLKEGVLVKRVYARPHPGTLILRSDNPSYNAIQVSSEEVLQLYKVEMFFSTDLGPQENNLHAHIARLDGEIAKIKKALEEGRN